MPDDPVRARSEAILVLSRRPVGAEAASVALRVVGLVERERGRLSEAGRRLRRSIEIAESAGLTFRAAQARGSLALVLLQSGDPAAALLEIERASNQAPVEARGTVLQQRAIVLMRLGRLDEALDVSRQALVHLRRVGDRVNEARTLTNRGVLHAYRGELGLASADLRKALALYRKLDSGFAAAQVLHNLGYVAALAGDVPEALRLFDEAAHAFGNLGEFLSRLHVDRAELLLSVRLLPEARREAELGVVELEAQHNRIDLAEARLLLGEVALAEGDLAAAMLAARRARGEFRRQQRQRWAVQARFIECKARWAGSGESRKISGEAAVLAVELDNEGWVTSATDCRVIGAKAALESGQPVVATALLSGVDPRARNGPAAQRVRAWLAEALSRLAAGNRSGALAALRQGLKIAEEYRASLGSTELRVQTVATVAELADLGLALAFDSGRAATVLQWSERFRAGTLRAPRVTPPTDAQLAASLVSLRDTVARMRRATLDGEDTRSFAERVRRLEGDIRRRSRVASGDFLAAPPLAQPEHLRAAIADRVLVEFVEHRGMLYAIVSTKFGFRLRFLSSATEIARDRASLQFALSRLALRRSSRPSLEAGAALLERSCIRLGEQLIAPLLGDLGDADLIVVPTGDLHALPWALLSGMRGRTVTVAPSSSLWLSLESAPSIHPNREQLEGDDVVLVAGPRVQGGVEEIRALRELFYEDASVFEGPKARAGDVAKALEGRRIAHVAAHGTFRSDNAQFSSLELADGPLTVYDLERIGHPPEWLVLSACDAGRSEVHPGDELMGTSAAMLSLGTQAIVSSVAPVPDIGATPVMLSLHSHLARGLGLAEALARAQAEILPETLADADFASSSESSQSALAAGVFVCLGAG